MRFRAVVVFGLACLAGISCSVHEQAADQPVSGFAGVAAAASSPPTPAKVLIIATCTVNASYLGPYGSDLGLTPNLDAFAARGAVFEAHRTEAGASGIAYASIFASSHADGHDVFMHPKILDQELDLISESLSARGYDVWYCGGHAMASPKLRYGQGAKKRHWDLLTYPDGIRSTFGDASDPVAWITTGTITHMPYKRDGLEIFTQTSDAFKALSSARVEELLAIFYGDPRGLQYRHEEFIEERGLTPQDVADLAVVVETLYRLNIARLDTFFGEALAVVGEDTLVVFTADHGESLYKPGATYQWSHSRSLSRDVLRVPFIVAGPGIVPARHEFVTRSIDVAPTVAGLVGAPKSEQWQGVDLSGILRGETEPPDLVAGSHTGFSPSFARPLFALQRGDLVAWSIDGQYTVRRDVDEDVDIFDATNPEHQELVELLRAYERRMRVAHDPNAAESPDDSEEILRSLGYIE